MVVSRDAKAIICPDLDFAIAKLGENITFDEKLFYFSATFGAVSRALNTNCTPALIYLHHILSTVYASIYARIQALKSGDLLVQIDDQMMTRFVEYAKELGQNIDHDLPLEDVLMKLVNLAYATTGNGFYLYKKGDLTI